jgi:hypothetical protein
MNYTSSNRTITQTTGGYLNSGNSSGNNLTLKPAVVKSCTGQNVSNCLADVYTNHGWLSVWVTVQSAFIPATVAAFAAGCAVINCVK